MSLHYLKNRAYSAPHVTNKDLGYTRLGRNGKIIVDFERGRVMRGWKPRRLGGGLGGNIKSGQLRFGCKYKPFKRFGDKRCVIQNWIVLVGNSGDEILIRRWRGSSLNNVSRSELSWARRSYSV